MKLDDEFVKQLPEREQEGLLDNKINNMRIFQGKQWILCLGVIVPDILDKYELTTLKYVSVIVFLVISPISEIKVFSFLIFELLILGILNITLSLFLYCEYSSALFT